MNVGDVSEDHIITHYFAPISADLSDDVAIVSPPPGQSLLVSCDALMEDVHFLRRSPANWVGQKTLRVNASDIVASGGVPRWATLSICLPKDLPLQWLADFAQGLHQACKQTGITLIGGDTTASPAQISISLTVFGCAKRPIRRSGANLGDLIVVTGQLGGAHLGLDYILNNKTGGETWVARHFIPPYRLAFVQKITEMATAMMDLSDGLSSDLPRLCRASNQGATIYLDQLPKAVATQESQDIWIAAEDYELLFTVAEKDWQSVLAMGERTQTPVTCIGKMTNETKFLYQNREVEMDGRGWQHFR